MRNLRTLALAILLTGVASPAFADFFILVPTSAATGIEGRTGVVTGKPVPDLPDSAFGDCKFILGITGPWYGSHVVFIQEGSKPIMAEVWAEMPIPAGTKLDTLQLFGQCNIANGELMNCYSVHVRD
jgi:hypothetical protein